MVPLCIPVIVNYFIVQAMRRTHAVHKKISSRHLVTLMLISVIVVFMVCVTPDAIMSAFFGYGYYKAGFLVRGVREIADLLLTVNSAVNFILYYTFNKIFRRSFYALFCRNCKKGMKAQEELLGRRSSLATVKNTTGMNGNSKPGSKSSKSSKSSKKDTSLTVQSGMKQYTYNSPPIDHDLEHSGLSNTLRFIKDRP